ncbi:MAG: dienelactone hydrolase family protein, partial [Candidatus Theseobacter exili]|nr:dienelactone hydrolase family protein [Candidatus Theseobacter exili]
VDACDLFCRYTETKHIIIVGFCMGAKIALSIIEKLENVKGLIMWNIPVFSTEKIDWELTNISKLFLWGENTKQHKKECDYYKRQYQDLQTGLIRNANLTFDDHESRAHLFSETYNWIVNENSKI